MDSHYDQVMKAREGVVGEETRLYFAYSTALNGQAFDVWRMNHGYEFFQLPEGKFAEAKGIDLIYDFPSRWWGGRIAGLVDKPNSKVFGRLFEISSKNWPIIQHKEGVTTEMSIERPIRVLVEGEEIIATAFTTAPNRVNTEGPISEKFVEALVQGAEQAGLPADYITHLRSSALE